MARLSKFSRSVAGSVVHITGAASGMGRATAILFADEGAKVALTDRHAAEVEAVAAEIRAAGGTAQAWALDVTDAARIIQVTNEIGETFGGLDILVNNAGIGVFAPIDSDRYEERWALGMDVLLTSLVRLIRASLPLIRKSAHGRIINISSTEGLGASEGASPYTVAKHGVVGLTRTLSVELGREAITVNCICPGPILTGLTAKIPEKERNTFAHRRTALRRYGDPEEVAHATLNFALPAASFITGAVLPVDGGVMVRNA